MSTEVTPKLHMISKVWQQVVDRWFKESGERFINAVGGVLYFGAAAHASYLALVPAPLRIPTSRRNHRFWKVYALSTVLSVAVYDSLHNARITRQQHQLQVQEKELRAKLRRYTDEIEFAAFSTWQARKAAHRAALEAQARVKEEAFYAAMKRKQQQVAEEREADCQALYSEVLDGVIHGSGVLREVQQVLDRADAVRQEQRVQLYQLWNTQVFEKIQERIKQGMSRTTVQQLEASLKAASDDYIHATNRKLGVFRDVIIESDYNPLKPLNNSIKVPTSDIIDPLKRDLLKAKAEKALLVVPGSPGSRSSSNERHSPNTLAKAVARHTLEVHRWGEGQINATPYGHCIDESGNYTIKRADPKRLQQTASHLYVDDYSSLASPEPYRPGKHMTHPVINGGRKDLLDLLSGSCSLDPVVTGGDSWLEHKGKKFVAAPDVLMGRKGLMEVLQQTSNPYADHRALDDSWLKPSGTLKVPGPEHQSGRAGFTEIIQQSTNPYTDGRSLGDSWLDHKGKRRVVPGSEG